MLWLYYNLNFSSTDYFLTRHTLNTVLTHASCVFDMLASVKSVTMFYFSFISPVWTALFFNMLKTLKWFCSETLKQFISGGFYFGFISCCASRFDVCDTMDTTVTTNSMTNGLRQVRLSRLFAMLVCPCKMVWADWHMKCKKLIKLAYCNGIPLVLFHSNSRQFSHNSTGINSSIQREFSQMTKHKTCKHCEQMTKWQTLHCLTWSTSNRCSFSSNWKIYKRTANTYNSDIVSVMKYTPSASKRNIFLDVFEQTIHSCMNHKYERTRAMMGWVGSGHGQLWYGLWETWKNVN